MTIMIVLFVLHGLKWVRSEGRGITEAYPRGYQFDGLAIAAKKARASIDVCLQMAAEGKDVSIAYDFLHPRKGATWTWGTLESRDEDVLTLREAPRKKVRISCL